MLLAGNVLHPREPGQLDNVVNFLDAVATSGMWVVVHTVLLIGITLLLCAYLGAASSLSEDQDSFWPQLGSGLAVVGGGLGVLFMLTEATAVQAIAADWAATSGDARQFAVAAATPLFHLSLTLSTAAAIFLFGLAPLAIGQALRTSGTYPAWLGRAGILVGLISVGANLFQVFSSMTTTSALILVPIGIAGATVWLISLGDDAETGEESRERQGNNKLLALRSPCSRNSVLHERFPANLVCHDHGVIFLHRICPRLCLVHRISGIK